MTDLNANPVNTDPDAGHDEAAVALGNALRLCFRVLVGALVVLVVIALLRSYVVVKQHQMGIVYRFGREVRIMKPGEHGFVWPTPIEEFRAYMMTREQSVETKAFMFGRSAAEKATADLDHIPETLRTGLDGFLLTGDRNIVHCSATLFYQVTDPLPFYEMQASPETLLRRLVERAVVDTVSGMAIEEALLNVHALAERARLRLTTVLDALEVGVKVNRLVLKPIPPRQVKDAFDEHIAAAQEASQLVKEAQAYADTVGNDADSRHARIVALADAERERRVETAKARCETYRALLTEYRQSPEVVAREIYTDTLERILRNAEEKFLVDEQTGRTIRVMIGRERQENRRPGGDTHGRNSE